jgi:hypothetical protein
VDCVGQVADQARLSQGGSSACREVLGPFVHPISSSANPIGPMDTPQPEPASNGPSS